ncbi:MAG: hypothetical protein ACHREM_26045 [Polyangiales bacterium]
MSSGDSARGPAARAANCSALVALFLAIAWDTQITQWPMLTGLASVGCAFAAVFALVAFVVGRRVELHARVAAIAFVWLSFGVALVATTANRRLATRRASVIVAAIERYRAERGSYPETLHSLVPTYMPDVPRAKWTLGFADFKYWPRPEQGDATLFWTDIPPFGRPTYSSKRKQWHVID